MPIDELLVKKGPRPILAILAVAIVIIGLGIGGYFLYPVIFQRDRADRPKPEAAAAPREGARHELTDEILERRFVEKDSVVIPFKDNQYEIVLSDISDKLTLTVPGGTNVLRIGDERSIDLDGDAKMDIKVYLTDIDASGDRPAVVLRFDRFVKQVAPATEAASEPAATDSTAPVTAAISVATIGSTQAASRESRPVTIIQNSEAEPFAVSAIFRGYCLFRYVIDGQVREERYFHKGETIDLDVTREVRLWISNAGNVIAKVAGVEVNMGRPGEVTAKMISWTPATSGSGSALEMEPVY